MNEERSCERRLPVPLLTDVDAMTDAERLLVGPLEREDRRLRMVELDDPIQAERTLVRRAVDRELHVHVPIGQARDGVVTVGLVHHADALTVHHRTRTALGGKLVGSRRTDASRHVHGMTSCFRPTQRVPEDDGCTTTSTSRQPSLRLVHKQSPLLFPLFSSNSKRIRQYAHTRHCHGK